MEQTVGREKAKGNIILFVIGVFIGFIGASITAVGSLIGNSTLAFVGTVSLVGLILEIIAIIRLRNVNRYYANALWSLILDLLINLVILILTIIVAVQNGNASLENANDVLEIISTVAEAAIVVYFVLGTNTLAQENNKGMPVLTKTIIYGYMGVFTVSLIFNLLSFIPAIGTNQVVVLTFGIVILVLYVIREVAFILFLIRSLFRVK